MTPSSDPAATRAGEAAPPGGPVEVALAVLRTGDAVLLQRRSEGDRFAGRWELPGGKVRPGETPMAAAAREAREEVGVAVVPVRVLGVHTHRYLGGPWVRLHVVEVDANVLPAMGPDRAWVPLAAARSEAWDVLEGTRPVLDLLAEAFLRRRSGGVPESPDAEDPRAANP